MSTHKKIISNLNGLHKETNVQCSNHKESYTAGNNPYSWHKDTFICPYILVDNVVIVNELISLQAMQDAAGLPVNVQVAVLPFQEELCLNIMKQLEEN